MSSRRSSLCVAQARLDSRVAAEQPGGQLPIWRWHCGPSYFESAEYRKCQHVLNVHAAQQPSAPGPGRQILGARSWCG